MYTEHQIGEEHRGTQCEDEMFVLENLCEKYLEKQGLLCGIYGS